MHLLKSAFQLILYVCVFQLKDQIDLYSGYIEPDYKTMVFYSAPLLCLRESHFSNRSPGLMLRKNPIYGAIPFPTLPMHLYWCNFSRVYGCTCTCAVHSGVQQVWCKSVCHVNLISHIKYPNGAPEIRHRDSQPAKFRVGKTSVTVNRSIFKGGNIHIVPISQSENHREDRELLDGKIGIRKHHPN